MWGLCAGVWNRSAWDASPLRFLLRDKSQQTSLHPIKSVLDASFRQISHFPLHPSSLTGLPFHTTEVRIPLSLPLSPSCSFSLWWGKNREKLSSSSARGVSSCGALKNSDVVSPTSPCCKQGLISAFITGTNTGQAAQAHRSVTSSCFAQCIFTRVSSVSLCCSTVQYLSGPRGEDQLEGDWRINAILKQNATCQLFTPSLPYGGWMSWFSWRTVNLSPWPTRAGRKENHTSALLLHRSAHAQLLIRHQTE